MASQLFICLSFVCFFFKSPIFDSLPKHRACTPVALGIGYVDFTGMTGFFFSIRKSIDCGLDTRAVSV